MDTLRLKPRQPVTEEVEDWDDDDFMIDNDDLAFRGSSTATNAHSSRRDSHSSFRSDRESLGGQEERHVHLPGDDEKSTLDAIAAAAHAGIPIPADVPPSALMGGTIRRLGGRSVKKIVQEDWGDDMELPESSQGLRLKSRDGIKFPEAIRQVSGSGNPSPVKKQPQGIAQLFSPKEKQQSALATPINLDKFKDNDEDDDVFGDGDATIRPPKLRPQTKPISLITPPTPQPPRKEDDDFEMDLELPSDGKLQLSRKRDIPKTPALSANDDFDWGEGSLGTRFGGTRRDALSNRSSSASALSPSIASSITAESEDETLDGLELPLGPLDLGERLKRRKLSRSPERSTMDPMSRASRRPLQPSEEKEDPLSGLELGDGDVFGSGKHSLHRNVKVKEAQPAVPGRPKAAVSLIFTNKPVTGSSGSRLPRPMIGHERSHTQPSLEPVSESGGPIQSRPSRRSQSRMGHSTQSSISSIHTPTTPTPTTSFYQQTTPRRKEIGQKASTAGLRGEPTTTNAQLLRLKRSLPALRSAPTPAKSAVSRFERPPSRNDPNRPQSSLRPKTPVDKPRLAYESSAAQARKPHAPFLPAGASQGQSQNVNAKTSRAFRRHDSDHGPEVRPLSRAFSRSTMRSPSPRRLRNAEMASEPIWQQLSKPRRLRQFGDGHELDGFDDLPTSAQTESKFTKQPIGSGNRNNIRNRLYQNVLPDRNTPSPVSPYSPRAGYQPHFARDTTASRLAREASLAQRVPQSGPLAPLTSQRVAQLSTRANLNPSHPQNTIRAKKARKPQQQKPHLISNLNSGKESKVVNGMTYNPATYRWEGNENALRAFNAPASTPSTASIPAHIQREKEASTPGPVLIKDMSTSKGAKRIGDMVFDPQAMCWLKVDTAPDSASDDPMEGFNAMDDDDPFKDIPDLEDKDMDDAEGGHGRVSDIKDEWLVGEEFDVGPEFIRRQREEQERWHKKCQKWVGTADRDREAWRWAIKNIVSGV
ncbi:hypothetical protein SLS62_005804 [Diatrype stigma]|uniref:Cytokinesis regulator n=1 Tax=Diatrype stigma TaxID=117547 RepID=A0AAN9YS88_9PEZI